VGFFAKGIFARDRQTNDTIVEWAISVSMSNSYSNALRRYLTGAFYLRRYSVTALGIMTNRRLNFFRRMSILRLRLNHRCGFRSKPGCGQANCKLTALGH